MKMLNTIYWRVLYVLCLCKFLVWFWHAYCIDYFAKIKHAKHCIILTVLLNVWSKLRLRSVDILVVFNLLIEFRGPSADSLLQYSTNKPAFSEPVGPKLWTNHRINLPGHVEKESWYHLTLRRLKYKVPRDPTIGLICHLFCSTRSTVHTVDTKMETRKMGGALPSFLFVKVTVSQDWYIFVQLKPFRKMFWFCEKSCENCVCIW